MPGSDGELNPKYGEKRLVASSGSGADLFTGLLKRGRTVGGSCRLFFLCFLCRLGFTDGLKSSYVTRHNMVQWAPG
jgi:hypothetical protein